MPILARFRLNKLLPLTWEHPSLCECEKCKEGWNLCQAGQAEYELCRHDYRTKNVPEGQRAVWLVRETAQHPLMCECERCSEGVVLADRLSEGPVPGWVKMRIAYAQGLGDDPDLTHRLHTEWQAWFSQQQMSSFRKMSDDALDTLSYEEVIKLTDMIDTTSDAGKREQERAIRRAELKRGDRAPK